MNVLKFSRAPQNASEGTRVPAGMDIEEGETDESPQAQCYVLESVASCLHTSYKPIHLWRDTYVPRSK
jgi:hypothetical protein